MFKWTPLALVLGFIIDLFLGDPRWLYHPVRVIGLEISFLEKKLRGIFPKTPKGERQAGLLMVILLCILCWESFWKPLCATRCWRPGR